MMDRAYMERMYPGQWRIRRAWKPVAVYDYDLLGRRVPVYAVWLMRVVEVRPHPQMQWVAYAPYQSAVAS